MEIFILKMAIKIDIRSLNNGNSLPYRPDHICKSLPKCSLKANLIKSTLALMSFSAFLKICFAELWQSRIIFSMSSSSKAKFESTIHSVKTNKWDLKSWGYFVFQSVRRKIYLLMKVRNDLSTSFAE